MSHTHPERWVTRAGEGDEQGREPSPWSRDLVTPTGKTQQFLPRGSSPGRHPGWMIHIPSMSGNGSKRTEGPLSVPSALFFCWNTREKIQVWHNLQEPAQGRGPGGSGHTQHPPEGEESHDDNGDQELDHQDGVNLQGEVILGPQSPAQPGPSKGWGLRLCQPGAQGRVLPSPS